MKKSSLIGHVVELFQQCITRRRPADETVQLFFHNRRYLGAADRRFISDDVYGMIRNLRLLQLYVSETSRRMHNSQVSERKESPLLLYGAYAVKIKGRIPDDVGADILPLWTAQLPEWDCPKALQMLVTMDVPGEILEDPLKRISILYSLPEFVVEEWFSAFGPEQTDQLAAALNQPAPTTIRVNTLQTSIDQCQRELSLEGVETSRTEFSPHGLVLKKRTNIRALQTFKRGWFELQDEGSQILSLLVEPEPGETIVDACAGGGGKALHLAALMENKGVLWTIDAKEERLSPIDERARRGGITIFRSLLSGKNSREIDRLSRSADRVLIDAPCSGSGTFRRNPGAKLTLDAGAVDHLTHLQEELLERYSELVKPGGRLVYATCSLLKKENEERVQAFLQTHPDFSLVSADHVMSKWFPSISVTSPFMLLLPHKLSTDGFFAAIMTRRESSNR